MSATRAFQSFRGVTSLIQRRTITMSTRLAAEGSTGSGASRPGGQASGDAFTKREKANEDYYVKEQEKQKLKQLKEKIAQQKEHLAKLEDHVNELSKGQK